ncbi:MAG: tetratricopeptide repeat protein [Terricaulis sp.]|nr:tetratricopeptide repeat protein [Terricaulis sp.]
MRKALWAGCAAVLAMAGPAFAQTEQAPAAQAAQAGAGASPLLAATSPPDAAPDRSYDSPEAALRAADLDYVVTHGRAQMAEPNPQPIWLVAVFADEMAAGRTAEARRVLERAPGGLNGPMADMLEPFLLAAEGRPDRGVERVDAGNDNLPAPLPEVARALVFESAGRLPEAAAVYAAMAERLDLTPPPRAEPSTLQEFERSLAAPRTAHSVYRAALTHHRLGRTAEARRYYGVVKEFAPRSVDVDRNLARLEAGEPPVEAALDAPRALGRWMLFLAEFVTQAEMLTRVLAAEDPALGLDSTTGSALLQFGVQLAGDADDWRLHAASQLAGVRSFDGAERILSTMPAESVFAPDAEIARAGIYIERDQDAQAIAAAERALANAGDRWSIIASAGDIYRQTYRPRESTAVFDRAYALTEDAEERADILGWRAYAHRFAGNYSAATADARRALELDPSVDTRMLYVSILMDDPRAWSDGIDVARALFAEQPDSVLRLNALGYALIQKPEGLEEGYRLLWRGYAYGQTNYAVIDSLGWAYYLYGRFDDALTLIQRSAELSVNAPNAEILDHLGDVYWRLNRRDEARDAWRQALAARPDTPRRTGLERKLSRGLTEPAPRQRELPRVTLPQGPGQRETL